MRTEAKFAPACRQIRMKSVCANLQTAQRGDKLLGAFGTQTIIGQPRALSKSLTSALTNAAKADGVEYGLGVSTHDLCCGLR